MSGENQESPGLEGRPGQRRPRPATIDLTATEMPGEPSDRVASEQTEAAESPASQESSASQEPVASQEDDKAGATGGLAPWMAGGAVGATVALAMVGALWGLGVLRQGEADGLDARLGAVEQGLRQLAARPQEPRDPRLDALATRLDAVEQNAGRLADIEARVAQAEAAARNLKEEVSGLGRRLDEAAATIGAAAIKAAQDASDAARAAAQDAVKEPTGESEQSPGTSAAQQALQTLQGRIGALEERLKSLQTDLGATKAAPASGQDLSVRRAILARSLLAAAESGQAFSAELASLKALGAEASTLAALEPYAARGLPNAADLRRDFAPVARTILAAAEPRPTDGGVIGRLQASAERLVRVRPVTEGPGQDAPSIIARIEAQLGRGDVAAAVAELSALPPELRAPAAEWLKRAQARLAGLEAARRLAEDAVRALGRTAS